MYDIFSYREDYEIRRCRVQVQLDSDILEYFGVNKKNEGSVRIRRMVKFFFTDKNVRKAILEARVPKERPLPFSVMFTEEEFCNIKNVTEKIGMPVNECFKYFMYWAYQTKNEK